MGSQAKTEPFVSGKLVQECPVLPFFHVRIKLLYICGSPSDEIHELNFNSDLEVKLSPGSNFQAGGGQFDWLSQNADRG